MPDRLDELSGRLSQALAAVRWAEPGEIRARARRRTLYASLAASLAVLLVLLPIAGYVWLAGDEASPVGTNPTPTRPSTPATATSPAPSVTADPGFIPVDALIQPEDVGADQALTNRRTNAAGQLDLWLLDFGQCPEYAALGIAAYEEYSFVRAHSVVPAGRVGLGGSETLFVQALRYPDSKAAVVVDDVRRALAACAEYDREGSEASTPSHPAHTRFTWKLLAEDLAGDESLLIRLSVSSVLDSTGEEVGEPVVMTLAVVRVNDLVSVVARYSTDAAEIANLAPTMAARLCLAANPRC